MHVGLGTGSKEAQLVQLQLLIGAQEKAIAAGLVDVKVARLSDARAALRLVVRKGERAARTPAKQAASKKMPVASGGRTRRAARR